MYIFVVPEHGTLINHTCGFNTLSRAGRLSSLRSCGYLGWNILVERMHSVLQRQCRVFDACILVVTLDLITVYKSTTSFQVPLIPYLYVESPLLIVTMSVQSNLQQHRPSS